ncbi:hypothetical protein BDZ94DRAFT_1243279 [Collybia nuda]|uniref:G domain-containing protein n=1 Tax=Collybia nuda TaxID=64659 RepID=A0A9P5YIS8_9AGAR|nr:hypothetical protein BDZ94DRAFT_1243279 [Collybia nuda]
MGRTPIQFLRDLLIRNSTLKVEGQDILILVVGPSGAGKSNFIKSATSKTGTSSAIVVSHGLEPSTQSVQLARCTHPNDSGTSARSIVFVDTPGLHNEGNGWREVETEFRKRIDTEKARVAGILYLHRISDNRITEPPFTNQATFQTFCGEDIGKKICIVTTYWDKVDQSTGEKREKDIENKYCAAGTPMARFELNKAHDSAWLAVSKILSV